MSCSSGEVSQLSAGRLAALSAKGVDKLDSTDDKFILSFAQYQALGAIALTADDVVTVTFTHAEFAALTDEQIADMRAKGVDVLALKDTGQVLSALTVEQITALAAKGIETMDAQDDSLNLTATQYAALNTVKLSAADVVTISSDGNYTLSTEADHLTLTGSANISGTGNGLANFIRGNAGNNTLIGLEGDDSLMGGAGADRMEGGAGSDLYWVDNAGDVVVDSGPGFDRVLASVSYTLAANIEYLAFEGSGNFVGTGNELDNTMYGNTGANTLDGGAGRDQLDGGEGNDMLMGGAGDDTITDWMGDDVLDGGAGKDDLRGGVGNDTYYVDALDIVTELAGQGLDTVIASESFALGALAEIEVLLAQAGTAAINLTGNEIANTITGNDGANQLSGQGGDDILNGGAGNDTMSGGLGSDVLTGGVGNDTYFVDALDTVTELAGQGTDTVTASESFTLGASVEIEVLLAEAGASAINLTGNDIANTVTGNDGVNQLSGQGGNDILNGGLGNDILTGGKGKDRFVFDSRPDAKLNLDRILDFKAKDDTIALENAVFVKLGKKAGALKASMFYAGKKAHDKDDRVIYDKKTGSLYYDADGTGKSKAVKFATVKKGTFIDHHDFLVI